MLTYPIDALKEAGVGRVIVVVGHQAERVRSQIQEDVEYVVQREQLGTAHAVGQTAELLKGFKGTVVVTYGDTPLYRAETYERFITEHQREGAVATVMSTMVPEPYGYGRIVRNDVGGFDSIVEQKEITSPEIEGIQEINTGTYAFASEALFDALQSVTNDNQQGEYYLPDALAILHARGEAVRVHVLADSVEALGINDRTQLAQAEEVMRQRTLMRLMESGVTVIDPQSTYVHPAVDVGADTVIHPFSSLEGTTRVGERCTIGPHARLVDSEVASDATVHASFATQSTIGTGAVVGPFANLSPGSRIVK